MLLCKNRMAWCEKVWPCLRENLQRCWYAIVQRRDIHIPHACLVYHYHSFCPTNNSSLMRIRLAMQDLHVWRSRVAWSTCVTRHALARTATYPSTPMSPSYSERKTLHRLIRYVSGVAATSFFTEIRVIGGENVPSDGPIIVYVLYVPMTYLCFNCHETAQQPTTTWSLIQ